MTRIVLPLSLLLFVCAFPAGAPNADVLLIEEVRQAERMELPENGTTMTDVRAQWGEPAQRHAPVGDPPIARWDYDGWSVYFEYELVLFTVLHQGAVLDSAEG